MQCLTLQMHLYVGVVKHGSFLQRPLIISWGEVDVRAILLVLFHRISAGRAYVSQFFVSDQVSLYGLLGVVTRQRQRQDGLLVL